MDNNFRISNLKLSNYRNHKFFQILPKNNIILVCGKNGSGKTNILESISLFDSSSGFRNSNLSELINSNLNGPPELFGVNISAIYQKRSIEMGLGLKKKNNVFKKILSINTQKRAGNSLGEIMNIFWVLPRMAHIFDGAPEERRNFLDLMISSVDHLYKKNLSEYKKYKNERLKILKRISDTNDNKWLDVIEQKMSEVSVVICDSRRVFLNALNKCFKKIDDQIPLLYLKLSGEIDKALEEKPALFVEDLISYKLKSNRSIDFLSGRTNFSVDKTDLLVFDKYSQQEAKTFSTGEQKIIIMSILFSFFKILENSKVSKVLFLLDDIFSYLDRRFIENIITKLCELKLQTWITDVRTEPSSDFKNYKSLIDIINIDEYRFKVANNKL